MTAIPLTTTTDNPNARRFLEPVRLGYPRTSDELVLCGHFDGHDVYRVLGDDSYVVVYANSQEAVFSIRWSSAAHWLSSNPDMDEWCTMRAIVKGQRALAARLDDLVATLRYVFTHHPDSTPEGWPEGIAATTCDTVDTAADWIEVLRKGVRI